jgi:PAS domain S-box-containing protein
MRNQLLKDGQLGSSHASYDTVQMEQLSDYVNEDFPGGFHTTASDAQSHFTHISNQMLRMLGFTRDEINSRFSNSILELIYPKDRQRFDDFYGNELSIPGKVLEFRYRMTANNEDGYIWVRDITKVCEADGEIFYQGMILDITDEIKTKRSLAHRNQDLDMLISSIPGGAFTAGDKFPYRYRHISPEAAALFGYTVDEIKKITGGYAANLIHADDRARAYQTIASALATRTTYIVKYRVICKDGSIKHVTERGKRIINEKGNPCLVSMYLDATHAAIPGFPSASFYDDHTDIL